MRVHLLALGCRLNEAELEQWSHQLRQRGGRLVDDPAAAELTVLNTCAVTADAVRKSRRQIRRLRRLNPTSKLVVSGCYVSLPTPPTAAELGVDLIVDNADKDRLVAIAAERFDLSAPPEPATAISPSPYSGDRSRSFIKVQDGCRYRCSYCVVTLARGAERSRPIAEIVAEINRRHRDGSQEAVLSGVHLGGYGADNGSSLAALLDALLERTTIPRLRLGSLEPWQLGEDFFALFANPRLLPHLHLPLQSGSDRILKRMARRTRRADFERLLGAARTAAPDLNITTDLIVGFPGETEQDWQQTLNAATGFGFGGLHIFPFSARAGTKAATLSEPVEREVLRRRVAELSEIDQRLRLTALRRACDRSVRVLWEGGTRAADNGLRRCYGYTPDYLRVALELPPPESDALRGRVLDTRLIGVDRDETVLIGRLAQPLSTIA